MTCGGKYLGDQPLRSMNTFSLCSAMDRDSSVHGQLGCARMIFMSGKSTATSSTRIGWPYFSLMPPPPRMPVPMPEWPVWKMAGSL
jgi:hypothetical protein